MIITWIAFVKNNSRSFIIYFEKLQLRKNSFGGFRILENFTQRFVFIKVETGYIVEFRTSKNQFHVRENGKITQNTFLFTLAFSHYLLPDEDVYLKELRRISLEADSLDVYNKASYSLARYYCNHNQKDSLFALFDQVKSIVVKRKAEPNVIFDIRSRICRLYLINQEYEMAMNEVVSLLQDVEKADYEQGVIFANEHLRLIFLLIGRNKEAIAPLKKSLSFLQKKGDQLSLEIEILSYISIAFMHLNELDDMKSSLEYCQERLERSIHFDQPSSAVEELVHKSSHCMFYSLWLNYYVAKK